MIFLSVISVDKEKGFLSVTSTAVKDPVKPLRKNHVRIDEFYQQFTLEFIEKKRTRVTFLLKIDPLVSAPAYFVNEGLKDSVFDILQGLNDVSTKPKYQVESYFSEENIELTREVMRVYLKKYVTDSKIIEMILQNNQLINTLLNSNDQQKTLNDIIRNLPN